MSNFSIFSLRVKKNVIGPGQKVTGSEPGWPLIYCRSKVCLGQGPSLVSAVNIGIIFVGMYIFTEHDKLGHGFQEKGNISIIDQFNFPFKLVMRFDNRLTKKPVTIYSYKK